MNNNSSHYRYREGRATPRTARIRPLAPLLAVALIVASCGGGPPAEDSAVAIVATTTVLGDVASNISGSAGSVTVLLPLGADPHDYRASSKDVADVMSADLVIANGLGLEEGLHDVLEAAESEGVTVLWVGDHVDPLPFGGTDSHGHDLDPHFWLDPDRMADATRTIAAELDRVDPGAGWIERGEAYAADLTAVDEQIAGILAAVPQGSRKLVTGHDSLRYLAARYDFSVIGTVVPGGSTLADPSSAEMAALITTLEREGVAAIFTEVFESEALAAALASELGASVTVVPLYTGSLGEEGSGADTLIGMLLTNAQRIAEALS